MSGVKKVMLKAITLKINQKNETLIKEQCHTRFLAFFHESNPPAWAPD